MYVRINRNDLIEALDSTNRAVSKKPQVEIMGYTHIECSEIIKITGYNFDLGISVLVDGEVLHKGACCFLGATVLNFIKKCSDNTVELTVDNNQMIVACGKPKLKLAIKDDNDYPILPQLENATEFEIENLSDKIQKVAFCAAENAQKPILAGINLKISKDTLTMSGCDGSRLSSISEESKSDKVNITIPKSATEHIKAIIGNNKVTIKYDNKSLKITLDNTTLYARLMSGEYLDLSKITSRSGGVTFVVDGQKVSEAIERLSVVAESNTPLVVKLEPNLLSLYCSTPRAELEEYITTDYQGDELKMGMNFRYFAEAVKGTVKLTFDVLSANTGVIIREEDRVQMIMPVAVRA